MAFALFTLFPNLDSDSINNLQKQTALLSLEGERSKVRVNRYLAQRAIIRTTALVTACPF
jgi:hypothetical protein